MEKMSKERGRRGKNFLILKKKKIRICDLFSCEGFDLPKQNLKCERFHIK
jgi:hypothetical protein